MWYEAEASMSAFMMTGIVMAVIGVAIIVISAINWGASDK